MRRIVLLICVVGACVVAPASAVERQHGVISVYKAPEGTGDGKITSSPGGIDCDPFCSTSVTEDVVTLTATPFPESTFEGWIGCESESASNQCTIVILEGSKTVGARFGGKPPPTYDLFLTKTSGGAVTSNPPGIDCRGECSTTSAAFARDSTVTLTATPDAGLAFRGWRGAQGACDHAGPTCAVKIDKTKIVSAYFGDTPPPSEMTVVVSKTGSGTVASSPGGISCGPTCSGAFPNGMEVRFTASPAPGWTFGGWGGECSGAGACVIRIDGPKAVSATFREQPPTMHALAVAKEGEGTVGSDPGGIDCGAACSRPFVAGTNVTLRAAPAPGWRFVEWRGDCSGSAPTCSVVMASPKSATAAFAKLDLAAPAVRALAGSGRRGRAARLRYRVSDDSGSARVTVTVYRGRRALARIRRSHSATNANVLFYYVSWRVPRKLAKRPPVRFCVAAVDPSGNTTARQSCAPLRVS